MYPLVIYSLFDFFFRYMAVDPNGPQLAVLKNTRDQLIIMLIVLQLFFIGVTFLISMFISHRIAGPLYKLGMYMKRVEQGSFEPVTFRKKDYFKELEAGFNQMLTGIKNNPTKTGSSPGDMIRKALEILPIEEAKAREDLENALKALQQN